MNVREETAASVDDLTAIVKKANVRRIVVRNDLDGVPSIRLGHGQSLRGGGGAGITFADGTDGLQLSSDNSVQDIRLRASPERCAIFNDTSVDSLGERREYKSH